MSKLQCKCGNTIYDSSDFISYKARFIADQDYTDFLDEVEKKDWHKLTKSATKYFREIFQCTNCNNIIILSPEGMKRFDFAPLEKDNCEGALRSYVGAAWKGTMTANFTNGSGDLFWHTNKDSGFLQDLTLEELRLKYFNKFGELCKLDILRHCFLTVNGKCEHRFNSGKK